MDTMTLQRVLDLEAKYYDDGLTEIEQEELEYLTQDTKIEYRPY